MSEIPGVIIPTYDSNGNIKTVTSEVVKVMPKPYDIGDRLWCFSSNFCDKTTWFTGSTYVSEKSIGTGDGVTTQFSMGDTYIIDVTHGKISQEDALLPALYGFEAGSFSPVVKLDSEVKTEREFDKESGGDYEINYDTGTLTFFSAPGTDVDVRTSYFKANSSTQIIGPPEGKQFEFEDIELQFSKDLVLMTDTIAEIWAYNPYDFPNKIYIEGTRGTYRTLHDFINWSRGAFPVIPQFGGSGARALANDIYQLRISYRSPIILKASQGAEWRVYQKDDIAHGGSFGTLTLYGVMNDED